MFSKRLTVVVAILLVCFGFTMWGIRVHLLSGVVPFSSDITARRLGLVDTGRLEERDFTLRWNGKPPAAFALAFSVLRQDVPESTSFSYEIQIAKDGQVLDSAIFESSEYCNWYDPRYSVSAIWPRWLADRPEFCREGEYIIRFRMLPGATLPFENKNAQFSAHFVSYR